MSKIKFTKEETIEKSRKIAMEFGERYKKEVMGSDFWTADKISNDWFVALKFWFGKSFYRGRRDSISDNFKERSDNVIANIGKDNLFDISENELETLLHKAGVNNHIDRKMVTETISFIKKIEDHNIANYCVRLIKENRSREAFESLRTMYGIGPKLASLFLRDICFIFKIEPMDREQQLCLQPVDTWVLQVAQELEIPGCTEKTTENNAVIPVVNFCLENNISPTLFNAGAWYVGARSFTLLLEII